MFTGVAVLQLVEEGLIDLDASISEYLSGFSEDVGSKITVRHLLRHESGWGSYFDKEFYRANWPWLRTVSDYMKYIPQIPLGFEPGTSRRYSNVGYVVLGAAIEAVTGQDYYQYVADHIFRPSGMENTDSYEADRPVPNLAQGYLTDTPEKPFSRLNTFMHSAKGTPAGGGFSTAEDLLRFEHALRNNRLLSTEYTNLFFRDFEGESATGVPEASVGFAGGGPGINAVLEMDFLSGLTVIVLSNYDPPTAEELGPAIMEMVRGSN
jgi:CubicO group peptidase (beta-lactamase class C family)